MSVMFIISDIQITSSMKNRYSKNKTTFHNLHTTNIKTNLNKSRTKNKVAKEKHFILLLLNDLQVKRIG